MSCIYSQMIHPFNIYHPKSSIFCSFVFSHSWNPQTDVNTQTEYLKRAATKWKMYAKWDATRRGFSAVSVLMVSTLVCYFQFCIGVAMQFFPRCCRPIKPMHMCAMTGVNSYRTFRCSKTLQHSLWACVCMCI